MKSKFIKLIIFSSFFILNSFAEDIYAEESVFYLMGTYAYFDLNDYQENIRAYHFIKDIEKKLSDYDAGSEISEINRNAGIKRVAVSEETIKAIRESILFSEMTNGYFDITIGVLTIRAKRNMEIGDEEARRFIGFRDIDIDEKGVFLKKKYMALDLGGMGKGYAIQRVYEYLKLPYGFIAIGGDMKVWGWKKMIYVYDPINNGILLEIKNKKDVCISTSGNYVKNHIETEDPMILQITTVSDNCSFTDAIATALFAMPQDVRDKFLKANRSIGAIILYRDGSVFMNKGIKEYFDGIKIRAFQIENGEIY